MSYILFFETWLVIAILFACAEIFLPGGKMLNLGIASLLVAIGVQQGFLDNWLITLIIWFTFSALLFVILFLLSKQFFSSSEDLYQELEYYGKEVEVVKKIGPGNHTGQVNYKGTLWQACSNGSEIKKGSHAKIICRENIALVVEAVK